MGPFPEIIEFDRKNFSRGIRILKHIMVSELGLVIRSSQDEEGAKQFGCSQQQEDAGEFSSELIAHAAMDQSLRVRSGRDHQEEIEAAKASGKQRGNRIFRKVGNIFGTFKRRAPTTQ